MAIPHSVERLTYDGSNRDTEMFAIDFENETELRIQDDITIASILYCTLMQVSVQ